MAVPSTASRFVILTLLIGQATGFSLQPCQGFLHCPANLLPSSSSRRRTGPLLALNTGDGPITSSGSRSTTTSSSQVLGFMPMSPSLFNQPLQTPTQRRGGPLAAASSTVRPPHLTPKVEQNKPPADNTLYKLLLAGIAMVYGTNFGAIKYLDNCAVDVSIVTAIRFGLATLALSPFLWRERKNFGLLLAGLEVGLWVALGYITQAIGLETTVASKSAFICSMSVVVVPLINGLLGRNIPLSSWLASALALGGVGMLTLEGVNGGPVIGDLWSFGQPIGFGAAFVRTEQYMTKNKDKALALTAAQMTTVFLVALFWITSTGHVRLRDEHLSLLADPQHLFALGYTGLITSALAVVGESVALSYVTVEETTVILTSEPLWASLFGSVVLHETLNPLGYAGGALVLMACIMSQLPHLLPDFASPLFEGDAVQEKHKKDKKTKK